MFYILIFLSSFAMISADDGWLVPEQNKQIDFDVETTPLEIKTDSTIGSGDRVNVLFSDSNGGSSGGITIVFSDPPRYLLSSCLALQTFPNALPTAADNNNVWRVTLTRTAGIRRLQLDLNDKEVFNFKFSDSTCAPLYKPVWSPIWSKDVKKIYFGYDTATDSYRALPEPPKCDAPTIGDGKVSPSTAISPGSSYSVTCNGGFNLKGNSGISCTEKDGKAILSTSPTCEKDAKDEDKTKLSFANCLKVNTALLVVLITAALLI